MSSEAGSSTLLPDDEQNNAFSSAEEFVFMLLLDAGRYKFRRWLQQLGYLVCFVQLLSVALPSTLPWQSSGISAFLDVLHGFRIFAPSDKLYSSYSSIEAAFWTTMAVVLISLVILLWMVRFNASGNLRATSAYHLVIRIYNCSLVFFSPLVCGLLVVWRCGYDESISATSMTLRGGSEQFCFGTTNAIFLGFSVLGLLILLPSAFAIAFGAFDFRLTSRNVFASISGMNSVFFVGTLLLMSVAEIVLMPFSAAAYSALCTAVFVLWQMSLLDRFPYFWEPFNHIVSGAVSVCAWASLMSFVVSFAKSDVVFYIMVAVCPVAFVISYHVSKKRLASIRTLKTSATSFMSSQSAGTVSALVREHEEDTVLPISKAHHVEIFARPMTAQNASVGTKQKKKAESHGNAVSNKEDAEDDNASEDAAESTTDQTRDAGNALGRYKTVFQLGRELFPTSAIVSLSYAIYVLAFSGNTRHAFRLSSEAAGQELSIQDRFLLWCIRKVISEIEDGRGGEENLRRRLNIAKKHQSHCRAAMRNFWSLLLKDNYDVAQLPRIISMIAHHENESERIFRRLLTEYGHSPRLLRAYGEFLLEIRHEEVISKLYFQRAELAEENAQAMARETIEESRRRKASVIANRIHQIHNIDIGEPDEDDIGALEEGSHDRRSAYVQSHNQGSRTPSFGELDVYDPRSHDPFAVDSPYQPGQSFDDIDVGADDGHNANDVSAHASHRATASRSSSVGGQLPPIKDARFKRVSVSTAGATDDVSARGGTSKRSSGKPGGQQSFVNMPRDDVSDSADGLQSSADRKMVAELSMRRKDSRLQPGESSISSDSVDHKAMERHILMENIRKSFKRQARLLHLASFALILVFLVVFAISFFFLTQLLTQLSSATSAVMDISKARSASMDGASYVKMLEMLASNPSSVPYTAWMNNVNSLSSTMSGKVRTVFNEKQIIFTSAARSFWSSVPSNVAPLSFPFRTGSSLNFSQSYLSFLDTSAYYASSLSSVGSGSQTDVVNSLGTWQNRSQNMEVMFVVKNAPGVILSYFDEAVGKYAVAGFNNLITIETNTVAIFSGCAAFFILAASLSIFVPIYRREVKNHHAALRLFGIVPKPVLKRISKSFKKSGSAAGKVDEAAERDVQMDMMEWVEQSSASASIETDRDSAASSSLWIRFTVVALIYIAGIAATMTLGLVMSNVLSSSAYVTDLATRRSSVSHKLHLLSEQWASPSVPLAANQVDFDSSGAFPFATVAALKTAITDSIAELRAVHRALMYGDSVYNIPRSAALENDASQLSLATDSRCSSGSLRNADGSVPVAAISCMPLNDLLVAYADQISRLIEGVPVGTGASSTYLASIRQMDTADLSTLLQQSDSRLVDFTDGLISNALLGARIGFGIIFPLAFILSCAMIGFGLKELQAEHVHTKRMLLLLPADVINNTPVILHFLLSGKRVDELKLQESLKEEQEKTKAILLSTADGVVITDDYGQIEMANPALSKIFGFTHEELIGSNIKMILPPALAERHDALIRNYCDNPTRTSRLVGRSIEANAMNKAGLLVPVRVTLTEATIAKRRFFSAFLQDLTSQHKERAEMKAQFVRMQAVLQAATEAVFITDEKGNVTVVNDSACKMFEYSREELVGANVNMLMPEPHRSQHHSYIENFLFTGRSKMVATGREVFAVKKSGASFPVFANIMHGKVDNASGATSTGSGEGDKKSGAGTQSVISEGKPAVTNFFAAFVRDLTDVKRKEEELILNAERIQAVIKASIDAVIVCDDKGIIESVNPSFTAILGYQRDEVVGQNVRLLVPLNHRAQHDDYIRGYLKTGISKIVGSGKGLEAVHKNGQNLPCYLTVREGRVRDKRFFACFLRDNREQQQLLTSKNREIDTIKTVFTSIVPPTVAERLLKEAEGPEDSEEKDKSAAADAGKAGGIVSVSNEFASVDQFPSCTIFFSDLVNFTRFSSQKTPVETVTMISRVLAVWDDLIVKHKLEKVKNIGDAVLAISNMYLPRHDHARAVCEFALDLIEHVKLFNEENKLDIGARIGINTGPVVAGILKTRFKTWDIYSDSVNMASRMEHSGQSLRVHISENTYALVRDYYEFEENYVQVKGVGQVTTYFITRRKS